MSVAFVLSGVALLLACLALYHAVQARRVTRALLDTMSTIRRHTAKAAHLTQRFSVASADASHARPFPAEEVQAAGQEGAANG